MRSQSSITAYRLRLTLLVLGVVATMLGCAQLSPPQHVEALPVHEKTCLAKFVAHDNVVIAKNKIDAQYSRIADYPFLRINRLLQALSRTVNSQEKHLAWLSHAAELDRRARSLENSNLPEHDQKDLEILNNCRVALVAHLAKYPFKLNRLLSTARVEDNYQLGQRIAGLYPVTRWPVLRGVLALHEQENPQLEYQPPSTANFYTTQPPEAAIATLLETLAPLSYDVLGFPKLDTSLVQKLFSAYTPVWAVDTASSSDLPGALKWSSNDVVVDTSSPAVYEHLSYALFEDKIVLQLMYTIWFPAVPPVRSLDIYAGEIDGLTFRVTLDHDFEPLIVDIMHNCGCYYMAFPSAKISPVTKDANANEPLWVPYELPTPQSDEQYIIQLRSGNHFVSSISLQSSQNAINGFFDNAQVIATLPYDSIRSLPSATVGNRSVFSSRGLIENSHRLERYVLWPMGVLSAGAMRQSGHHAIAFVGRRHFDDPELIDEHFIRRKN